jgi:hypothetical protein
MQRGFDRGALQGDGAWSNRRERSSSAINTGEKGGLMRLSFMVMRCAAVAGLLLLSGCIDPPQVKQVLGDREGYLSKNFSPATLPDAVQKQVSSKDGEGFPYRRMVLNVSWTMNSDDKEKQVKFEDAVTLINAGGAFLEELHEATRNGVPTTNRFSTTYRGMLILKSEALNVGNTMAGMTLVAKSFSQFDALRPDVGKTVEYAYSAGTTVQLMNFRDYRSSCVWGASYSASNANVAFKGDAQEIVCTNYNANDVLSGKTHYVFLKNYGTAILVKDETSSGVSEAHIDSVKIS